MAGQASGDHEKHALRTPVAVASATCCPHTSHLHRESEKRMGHITVAKGLHGVTAEVEQAEASSSILEYPPENLGESCQAVFSGIDLDDTRKAQCFPINKALFL